MILPVLATGSEAGFGLSSRWVGSRWWALTQVLTQTWCRVWLTPYSKVFRLDRDRWEMICHPKLLQRRVTCVSFLSGTVILISPCPIKVFQSLRRPARPKESRPECCFECQPRYFVGDAPTHEETCKSRRVPLFLWYQRRNGCHCTRVLG